MEIKRGWGRRLPAGLLVLGLGAGALVGCDSSPEPEVLPGRPGTVVEHDFTPPYTTHIKAGNVKVAEDHPADYDLKVRQCGRSEDPNADQNGCVTAWVDVSSDVYEKYPDGSTIVIPEKK